MNIASTGGAKCTPKTSALVVPAETMQRTKSVATDTAYATSALMNKLGARDRVEVAMWAYETRRVKG